MKLSKEALNFFKKKGSQGGKKSASKLTKEERIQRAKKSANIRWSKKASEKSPE